MIPALDSDRSTIRDRTQTRVIPFVAVGTCKQVKSERPSNPRKVRFPTFRRWLINQVLRPWVGQAVAGAAQRISRRHCCEVDFLRIRGCFSHSFANDIPARIYDCALAARAHSTRGVAARPLNE